jgi:hypothetical protein
LAAQVHNYSDFGLNLREAMVRLTVASLSIILIKINKMLKFILFKSPSEYPNKQRFLQENPTLGDAKFSYKKRV